MRLRHFLRSAALVGAVWLCPASPAGAAPAGGAKPEADMGMRTLDLSGTRGVDILLKAQPRCFFGDLDAMMLEARFGGGPAKLLVSLEPIISGPSGIQPQVREIPNLLAVYLSGVKINFTVPAVTEPALFGIYICRDSSGEGRCSRKPAVDFAAIFKPYQVKIDSRGEAQPVPGARPEGFKAGDKIYFFRPLIVSSNALYYPEKQMSDERAVLLEQYLAKLSGKTGAYKPELDEQRILSRTLGSLPLNSGGDRAVAVTLPRFDYEKCARRK